MEPFYVVLFKTDDKVYLKLNDNNSISAFKTENEGISWFEDGYNNYHKRSYEASMSVCVNNLTFQPSVIKVKDLDDIRSFISENEEDGIHPLRISNISGAFNVILADTELGRKKWDEGRKPNLITEDS